MNSTGASRTVRAAGASRTALGVVTVALLTVAAVMAAACAVSEPSQVATVPVAPEPPPADPPPPPEPQPPAAESASQPAPAADPNALPAVTVVDVVSGESLVLSSLAPADRPILVWFWAPH